MSGVGGNLWASLTATWGGRSLGLTSPLSAWGADPRGYPHTSPGGGRSLGLAPRQPGGGQIPGATPPPTRGQTPGATSMPT